MNAAALQCGPPPSGNSCQGGRDNGQHRTGGRWLRACWVCDQRRGCASVAVAESGESGPSTSAAIAPAVWRSPGRQSVTRQPFRGRTYVRQNEALSLMHREHEDAGAPNMPEKDSAHGLVVFLDPAVLFLQGKAGPRARRHARRTKGPGAIASGRPRKNEGAAIEMPGQQAALADTPSPIRLTSAFMARR